MARIAVVGSNQGIGLELCRLYAARGHEVLAACRKSSSDLQLLKVEIVEHVDVTSDHGVDEFAARVGSRPLDVLVIVAGIFGRDSFDELSLARMREQYEVNAMGPLRVVKALVRNLPPGAKLALLTSRMGSIADNSSGGHYGYRMSKAALNMAGRSLTLDLAPRGIAVALLHPGYVRTAMTDGRGDVSAAESAAQLAERIEAMNIDRSGEFRHANGALLPW